MGARVCRQAAARRLNSNYSDYPWRILDECPEDTGLHARHQLGQLSSGDWPVFFDRPNFVVEAGAVHDDAHNGPNLRLARDRRIPASGPLESCIKTSLMPSRSRPAALRGS